MNILSCYIAIIIRYSIRCKKQFKLLWFNVVYFYRLFYSVYKCVYINTKIWWICPYACVFSPFYSFGCLSLGYIRFLVPPWYSPAASHLWKILNVHRTHFVITWPIVKERHESHNMEYLPWCSPPYFLLGSFVLGVKEDKEEKWLPAFALLPS